MTTARQRVWWAAGTVWATAWTLLIIGLTLDARNYMFTAIFLSASGATLASWLISDSVAARVAKEVAALERVEVEKMARIMAQTIAQEETVHRLPPRQD